MFHDKIVRQSSSKSATFPRRYYTVEKMTASNQPQNKNALLILSCSLNPGSRSHYLATVAASTATALGIDNDLVDLRDWDLPICDGKDWFNHPSVRPMMEKVSSATAVLIASPIYNYDLNAAVKNVIELTGRAWSEKPVGMLCVAGGQRSYMAPMALANSLMFDFRCHVIPRYVYATSADFTESRELSEELNGRVRQLVQSAASLGEALRWVDARNK